MPRRTTTWGNALKDQGKLEEAIASYQQALRLKPDFAEAHNNLGNVLQRQGKLDGSDRQLPAGPASEARLCRGVQQPGNALKDQGKLDGSDRQLPAGPASEARRCRGPRQPHQWYCIITPATTPPRFIKKPGAGTISMPNRSPNSANRTRIRPILTGACASATSRPTSAIMPGRFFTMPLLSNHDHRQVEIFCYAEVARPDDMTERLRSLCRCLAFHGGTHR